MNKCLGCGALLQNNDLDKIGYCRDVSNKLCERCFRIKNYNDYKLVFKDNEDYINILKGIDNDNLVVLVVDLFNIPHNLKDIRNYFSNDILLVLTKRDLLPKSLYEQRIIDYFNNYKLNQLDTIMISSMNNYNYDLLYDKIKKYKKGSNVYIVGYTNAGKSTMINKLIYNYSSFESNITTSLLPSTTLDTIDIKLDDNLTLIDTPGIIEKGNIVNLVSGDDLKVITPKNTIKPIVYQIKDKQSIVIGGYAVLECSNKNNIVIYGSNNLNIERKYKKLYCDNFVEHKLNVSENSDIVISGLCFIKVSGADDIVVYTLPDVTVYTRKSLV